MKFYTYKPAPPLSRFIEFFWYCEDYILEHCCERILPGLQAQLLINLGEDELRWRTADGCLHRASGAGFSAESFHPIDIDTRQQRHIMGVLFLTGGASALSSHPAEETLDLHLDTGEVVLPRLQLRERLLEKTSVLERFLMLENLLLIQLASGDMESRDPVPTIIVSMLEAGASIKETTDKLGFTYKSLNRLCRARIGLTPKRVSRLLRFRKALDRIEEANSPGGWPEFALELGFADQAHLIREFQQFSTFTPTELLSREREHRQHIPLLR